MTLELDEKFFTVLATSETAVLSRSNANGSLTLWRLEWRDHASYPSSFEQEAWEAYMKAQTR